MTAIAAIALVFAAADAGIEAAWAEDAVPFHRPAELIVRSEALINPEEVAAAFTGAPADVRVGRLFALDSLDGAKGYLLYVDFLEPGEYALGTLALTLEDGTVLTASVPPFFARPLTPAEQAALMQFAPNAGPLDPPRPRWPWAAAAALAALGLALLLAWFVKRRSRPAPARLDRPKTCWDLALLRLRELEEEAADSPRVFYEGLSELLRDYAAARFDWPIHEWTTPEFRQKQEAVAALGPEAHARLAALLRQCDVVIFAQRRPGAEGMRRSAAWAREVIEGSVPARRPEAAA